MLKLLAATTNRNKVKEFRVAFRPTADRIEIITLADLPPGYEAPEETGSSFEENALLKACAASMFADMAAVADDSGLEVDALDGAPGINSARYGGEGASDAERNVRLLAAMADKTDRRARFVCAVALAYRGDAVHTFRGTVAGTLLTESRGTCGFGYDPVFAPDGYDRSFGELGMKIKNSISHRAAALKQLVAFIKNELDSMDDFEFE